MLLAPAEMRTEFPVSPGTGWDLSGRHAAVGSGAALRLGSPGGCLEKSLSAVTKWRVRVNEFKTEARRRSYGRRMFATAEKVSRKIVYGRYLCHIQHHGILDFPVVELILVNHLVSSKLENERRSSWRLRMAYECDIWTFIKSI